MKAGAAAGVFVLQGLGHLALPALASPILDTSGTEDTDPGNSDIFGSYRDFFKPPSLVSLVSLVSRDSPMTRCA